MQVDIELKQTSLDRLGFEVANAIGIKGYATLSLGLSGDELKALQAHLSSSSALQRPADLVADGVLGKEGTAALAVCTLVDPKSEQQQLRFVDDAIEQVCNAVCPYLDGLRLEGSSRTLSYVVKSQDMLDAEQNATNISGSDAPQLTQADCAQWLNLFIRQRLMLVFFAGPTPGLLKLTPLESYAEPHTLHASPGTMVVVRTDALLQTFSAEQSTFTICSWLMAANRIAARGVASKGTAPLAPAAQALADWAELQMQSVKAAGYLDPAQMLQLPRGWEMAMNHAFHEGHRACVRGSSIRAPGPHDPEEFSLTSVVGTDFVIEVPFTRWDHSVYYDSAPDAWQNDTYFRNPTNVKHCSFIDGLELFSEKQFKIPKAEARGMDPGQRMCLETAFDSLTQAGFTEQSMNMAYVGVWTGTTQPEWGFIPQSQEGPAAGTGASPTICSNRVSFSLGLTGPSMAVNTEMSSGATAILCGAEHVCGYSPLREVRGLAAAAALCQGHYCALVPQTWTRLGGLMDPKGRCFAFDASANGYIRSEAIQTLCIMAYADVVGDGLVPREEAPCYAVLSGYKANSSGRIAGRGLTALAPSGAIQEMMVADCCRHAGISPLDVEAVECQGQAGLLFDAVEVTGLNKTLRSRQASMDEPVVLTSVKPSLGNSMESTALTACIRTIHCQQFGLLPPNVHFRDLNPHIEAASSLISTEPIPTKMNSSFQSTNCCSLTGTNVHLIWWGTSTEKVPVEEPTFDRKVFSFWPAGGGFASSTARPSDGYVLVGSWNEWSAATGKAMTQNADQEWVAPITVGANRWEEFQILLDGDQDRILHPSVPSAPAGSAAEGPSTSTEAEDRAWRIDVVRDKATAGAIYTVKLSIKDRWQMVSWQREEAHSISSEDIDGKYYVAASWKDGAFLPMEKDDDVPGKWTLEVGPVIWQRGHYKFQIVRNRDWKQAFYPSAAVVSSPPEEGEAVLGPGESASVWELPTTLGDVWRIEFLRVVPDDWLQDGEESRQLRFERMRAGSATGRRR
mmetsp:Transcript_49737/g.118568  ORF Transcript_49737/g.118568 Transcript_49737/m.118568 type:complete len:1019 (+) Transcript_49737:82-3138(+)